MRLTGNDRKLVDSFIQHDDIFPFITDDYGMKLKNRGALTDHFIREPYWCIYPAKGVLFILTPKCGTTYEVHTLVKPEYRGANSVKAATSGLQWFFKNHPTCQKIISYIPSDNKAAKVFALKMKFKVEGNIMQSFLKDGKLIDQWIVGLEKERFLCQ